MSATSETSQPESAPEPTPVSRVEAARALVAHLESRPHLERYLTFARRMLARFAKESANG